MLKKVLSVLFAFVFAFLLIAKPAVALDYSDYYNTSDTPDYNNSQNSITECLFSQPDSGIEEIACNAGKSVATGLTAYAIYTGICYGADALATTIFPPAIVLAPYCNVVGGIASGVTAGSIPSVVGAMK